MKNHIARDVSELGNGSTLYVSRQRPCRLVVFVHGFGGNAISTWRNFDSPKEEEWWSRSDLLFVGYDSKHDNTLGVVHRLKSVLLSIYPSIPDTMRFTLGAAIRDSSDPYREILIVAHSLGGLVVRRLIIDLLREWSKDIPRSVIAKREWLGRYSTIMPPVPPLLAAKVALFSPATLGFYPTGWPNLVELLKLKPLARFVLRKSPAYSELDPLRSDILRRTKESTEEYAPIFEDVVAGLHPTVLWAEPENVVQKEDYITDRPSASAEGTSHVTICKPNPTYSLPWKVVESVAGEK